MLVSRNDITGFDNSAGIIWLDLSCTPDFFHQLVEPDRYPAAPNVTA